MHLPRNANWPPPNPSHWGSVQSQLAVRDSIENENVAARLARILLYGYAFLLPLESILSLDAILGIGAGNSLTKAYGIIVAALIVILRPHFMIAWTWPAYMLAAWLLWGLLSCYMNGSSMINSVVLNVGFALTIPSCLERRKHIEFLWLALALGGSLAAIATIITPSYTIGESRLIGLGQLNSNAFIIICGVTLLCSFYFLSGLSTFRLDSTIALALMFCVPILLWCIAATGSRTGWASLGAALLISAWIFAPPSPRRWLYRGITLVAGAAVAAVIFTNAMLADRVRTGLEGDTSSRNLIWQMAWNLFQERADPFWGMGLRQADQFLPRYAPESRWYGWDRLDVHSTYFAVLIETGYVGLMLFILAVILPVFFLAKNHRQNNLAMMATATATILLVSSLAKTWYTHKLFWLLWAMTISSYGILRLRQPASV